jgi:DNA-binding HxlR family transcriptional regulator
VDTPFVPAPGTGGDTGDHQLAVGIVQSAVHEKARTQRPHARGQFGVALQDPEQHQRLMRHAGRPVRGSATGRPVMAALDLLGRRWTLRVIWELHRNGAPIGFRDLRRRCDDMSSSVLATRLRELREADIAAHTAQSAWHLTPLGDDLVTAMRPLLDGSRAWAERE